MTQLSDPSPILFKRRHFDQEIILLCVRWYLTYKLSYRDLQTMMAERGIDLAYTTSMRWVQRYVPEFTEHWQHYARPVGTRRGASTKHISRLKGTGRTCIEGWIRMGKPSTFS